jgi:hypothetical protein
MDPLLALAELKSVVVDVEGISVKVREFSALEYAEFQDRKAESFQKAGAYLLQRCVLNDDGSPRWTEEEAEKVAGGSARVLTRLINAIHRLSGFGEKH